MDINSAFPSKYLKAADLKGRRVMVTISAVEMEDIGDDDSKPVVYFEGKSKGLVLNKTNSNMIIEITDSSETDSWAGQQIVLFSTKVDFQSRRVDAIRVDKVEAKKKPPVLDEAALNVFLKEREPGEDREKTRPSHQEG